jgi:hypothetical protein
VKIYAAAAAAAVEALRKKERGGQKNRMKLRPTLH